MKSQSSLDFFSSKNNSMLPDYFSLAVSCSKLGTNITMQVFTEEVTTKHMKDVSRLLKIYLPTILESTCFNTKNLSFDKEVTHTELGHLFEHILLEYLCKEKIRSGSNEAVFKGVTKWNWNKDTFGTFHIQIDVPHAEKDLLYFALEQSVLLLKRIIHYHASWPSYPDITQKPLQLSSYKPEKQMA